MEPNTLAPRRHGSTRLVVVDPRHPNAYRAARPAPPVGVLLVHAEPLVRAGLRAVLEQQRDIIVTDEASTGEEAVALASRRRPDVVLIDLRLPSLDGMDAVRRIVAEPGPGRPRVLVLSRSDRDEEVFAALRAGAGGLLAGDTGVHGGPRRVSQLGGGADGRGRARLAGYGAALEREQRAAGVYAAQARRAKGLTWPELA
jgi:CheY-like chemotaxis protein